MGTNNIPGYENNDLLRSLALLNTGLDFIPKDEDLIEQERYQETEEEVLRKMKLRKEHEQ